MPLILQPPLVRALVVTPNGGFGVARPRRNGVHLGVDFAASVGDQVVAAAGGTIARTGFDPPPPDGGGGGNFVIESVSSDGSDFEIGYMHLSQIDVDDGQAVAVGDPIGLAGDSGTVESGAHLHFQVKRLTDNGRVPIDPRTLLAQFAKKGASALTLISAGLVVWRMISWLREHHHRSGGPA